MAGVGIGKKGLFVTWYGVKLDIQCTSLKFHECSKLMLVDGRKDVLIFPGKIFLILALEHKFQPVCKVVKEKHTCQTRWLLEMLLILFMQICQGDSVNKG